MNYNRYYIDIRISKESQTFFFNITNAIFILSKETKKFNYLITIIIS